MLQNFHRVWLFRFRKEALKQDRGVRGHLPDSRMELSSVRIDVMKRLNSSQGKKERVSRDAGLLSRMLIKTGNSSIQFFDTKIALMAIFLLVPNFSQALSTREESLRFVGDGYEQLMVQMLYSQMKQSQGLYDTDKDNPFAPSHAEKIFQGMKDQVMVQDLAKHRPLGVSDMVVRSLKGDGGVPPKNLLK